MLGIGAAGGGFISYNNHRKKQFEKNNLKKVIWKREFGKR